MNNLKAILACLWLSSGGRGGVDGHTYIYIYIYNIYINFFSLCPPSGITLCFTYLKTDTWHLGIRDYCIYSLYRITFEPCINIKAVGIVVTCTVQAAGIKLLGIPQHKEIHGFSPNFQDIFTPRGSRAN